MPEIIIRKYTDADEAVLKKYMTNSDNRHYVKDIDERSRDKFTLAEYDGVVAGYLFASIATDNCQAFIYVSPEYRRRGIGTVLCHEAEGLCREKSEKEMWGYYYDIESIKFTDKLGFYFTTSSIDMEYTGGLIPEQKRDMIHKCKECTKEDYLRWQHIWHKGFHEMRVRAGYPNSKMSEATEEGYQDFIESDDNYMLKDGGKIIGHGVISNNEIGALAVDTEKFNKGYGTALAIFMTNEILRSGHKAAYSMCEAKNINSRRVHEKIGYKITETSYCSFKKIE
jgi:GNAT superfamily N-acetyltransferase